ncbi:MAG: CrcB family protein [Pseudomonadota bacterium]
MNVILIGLGGAIGAMLRYGFVVGGARLFGPGFPWGVFAANVIGSLLMGSS